MSDDLSIAQTWNAPESFTAFRYRLSEANILSFCKAEKEVIRVDKEGKLYWNGREVETDEYFRKAMLDLADCLCGTSRPLAKPNPKE